jgi:hypothetical protein
MITTLKGLNEFNTFGFLSPRLKFGRGIVQTELAIATKELSLKRPLIVTGKNG